ncbi:hypothetical protein EGH21_19315 [Halomicroarcula sp. F13]|uniref:Uncharacterized protein n=2 Tax=Haloarcula rubra TaxID=2487747 RepID=A0AAW4PU34_9EURY|nr:hypothetical protein [Halomicroarcula rubra]
MYRRDFMSAMGVGISTPFARSAKTNSPPEWVGDEILNRILRLASTLADEGIQGTMQTFVDLANEIAPIYLEHSDLFPHNLTALSDTQAVLENNYQAIKSIFETLDKSLNLRIASRPIAMLSYASKIGGILLSLGTIGNTAVPLHRANTKQGLKPSKIDSQKHQKFGFAILGLLIELSLFYVPFNYRFAWRGTRYLSNRVLYRVQRYLPGNAGQLVHTVLMILSHWFQRLGLEIIQGHLYDSKNAVAYAVGELDSLSTEFQFDTRYQAETIMDDVIWNPSTDDFLDRLKDVLKEFPVLVEFVEQEILEQLGI